MEHNNDNQNENNGQENPNGSNAVPSPEPSKPEPQQQGNGEHSQRHHHPQQQQSRRNREGGRRNRRFRMSSGGGGGRFRKRDGFIEEPSRKVENGPKPKEELYINCAPEEVRVAILHNNGLSELMIERRESENIVGNIYKGRVENVLPGISSAFVNIGLDKNAYLYVSDVVAKNRGERCTQIEKMIARGETILIQVAKGAIGTKGVKATMNISLPGRFLVYMPLEEHVGISKNIESEEERNRLRDLVQSMAPEEGGFIIRTEAEGADEKAIQQEIKYLTRLWDSVKRRFQNGATPSLVHRDLGLVFQTVRDVLSEDTSVFMLDSRREMRDVLEFMDLISPEIKDRVKLYEGKTPIFEAFGIETQIEKIRQTRADLPSGGYIIIQEAEGLCAIDVNTGKFTGKKSQEETVTVTNVEAAKEVARQLRLRNIGGIIVIDFIDMRHARNREKVTEALAQAVQGDRAKIKILPITRLGLIEMTRERKRESLFASLGESCCECHGTGRVLSRESLYIKVQREILNITQGRSGGSIRIALSPRVSDYFKERLARLETAVKHKVQVEPDPNIPWEDYRIVVE